MLTKGGIRSGGSVFYPESHIHKLATPDIFSLFSQVQNIETHKGISKPLTDVLVLGWLCKVLVISLDYLLR